MRTHTFWIQKAYTGHQNMPLVDRANPLTTELDRSNVGKTTCTQAV